MIPDEIPHFRARKYFYTRKLSHNMTTGDYAPVDIILYVFQGYLIEYSLFHHVIKTPAPPLCNSPTHLNKP